MRVCIPIEFQPQGGGHYFLRGLADYLATHGCAVVQQTNAQFDVLFTNHWMVSRREILRAIRHNSQARIIHRIDGAAQDYGRSGDADTKQRAVNLLADLTIFQSEYCRQSTRVKFPVITQDGPVIHNPVDVELFRPEGERMELPVGGNVACVTWSTNLMKGAASIYAVARANPSIGFVLCGQYPDAPSLKNVRQLGVLNRQELALALRSCDALLTFSQNEACPNHVLEALASGLPLLYHDSGAMSEVVGDCGLPVTETSFFDQLQQLLKHRVGFSAKARQRALTQFHPQTIYPRYVEAIQSALARPTTVPMWRRRWLAWRALVF